MLWLAPSQQNYSWAMYSSLENILAHYCISSIRYIKEKQNKTVKIRITVRECKLRCVNKDWLL
jgi:hypothetical protein